MLYVHRNHKVRYDGKPRTATSTFTQLLSSGAVSPHSIHIYPRPPIACSLQVLAVRLFRLKHMNGLATRDPYIPTAPTACCLPVLAVRLFLPTEERSRHTRSIYTHCYHCMQSPRPSCLSVPSPTKEWSHCTLHTKTHCPPMQSPRPNCLSVPSPTKEWSHCTLHTKTHCPPLHAVSKS